MPHMSPMNWSLMPFILLMILYFQIMNLHYLQPSQYPKMPSPMTSFSNWTWF